MSLSHIGESENLNEVNFLKKQKSKTKQKNLHLSFVDTCFGVIPPDVKKKTKNPPKKLYMGIDLFALLYFAVT